MKNSKISKTTTKTFDVVSVQPVGKATAIIPNIKFIAKLAKYTYALEPAIAEAECHSNESAICPTELASDIHDFLLDILDRLSEEDVKEDTECLD